MKNKLQGFLIYIITKCNITIIPRDPVKKLKNNIYIT